jgi:flagellar basal-body rod modification protein FlgD
MLTSNASPTPVAANSTANSSAAAAAAGTAAGPNLAGNFNEFLQLLTTQLQHQDPTAPLDPNQFTQELVQFSGVEQQINTNKSLTTMIALQQAQQAASALQFIGANVAVSGTTAQLANGQANWNYSVTQPATANINILNSSGVAVYSATQTVQPGAQTFAWNGLDSTGSPAPDGPYTLSISAVGANGQTVPVTTQIQGVVTAVDVSTTPPNLTIGGQSYPLNQITQILSAGTPTK